MNKSTALITGASSGIGLELARVMAAAGHGLILSARSEDKLKALAEELEAAYKVDVDILVMDLSAPNAAGLMCNRLETEHKVIDILINNAGFGDFDPFIQADWDKINGMIHLNMLALTELTHRLLPGMVERGHGYIMNVASTAAFQPGPWMAVYYATKAYVLSFSEALGYELRKTGVSVTTLCPGATESGFQVTAEMQDSALVKNKTLPSSAEVAEYAYTAMLKRKSVAVHGTLNWIMAQSIRFTPRTVVLRLVDALSRKK